MWKITPDQLNTYTYNALKNAHIESITDILHAAGATWQDFIELGADEIVEMFCEHCEGLSRFGQKSKHLLEHFLKRNQTLVLQAMFVEAYDQSEADLEESDLSRIAEWELPNETLLINVSIIKGSSLQIACIEDVIAEIEQDIEDSQENITDEARRNTVLEAIEITDWPADRPIFISEYAAKVYPELVVALTRNATLVLK